MVTQTLWPRLGRLSLNLIEVISYLMPPRIEVDTEQIFKFININVFGYICFIIEFGDIHLLRHVGFSQSSVYMLQIVIEK